MSEEENEISELSNLSKEMSPPSELEDRIVSQLVKKGLLHRKSHLTMRKLVFAIAASIVIFALGFISAEFFRSSPALRQYTYLLLLREDSHFAGGRTHESSRVKEYSQWARAVAKTGTEITGEKLKLESRLINSAGVQNKIQDSDGVIAGFILINARSDQDAIEKAFSCPHLRHGGNIELRRLDR